VVSI
jgi:7,8-dihydropterin-6-yl-methyl-4-(beta-D-ribofuranosyl)aminobenzene 5'-phosphate synthase